MGTLSRVANWARHVLVPGASLVQRPTPPLVMNRDAKPKKKRRTQKTRMVTRWLQRDVESAQQLASNGDLSRMGQLYRALGRDGMLLGLLGTRSGGLVRLPKRFSGDADGIAYLSGRRGKKGKFDRHFPPAEVSKLARDGFVLGVGVAEFIERNGCKVLVRLDPEFLIYRHWEDQWYYRSVEGLIPVNPGDGRWVLYTPGGIQDPWDQGACAALARAFVSKEHALFYRENWNSKLAHPARVAVAPQGASQLQKQSWFRAVMAWGINTVFGLTPGYDVKLLESNGVGYQSFRETIVDSNTEFMVLVAGQVTTTTGGTGFANGDIGLTIRGDLIEADGKPLATCLCEQALPWVLIGIACDEVDFVWDTRAAVARTDEAKSLSEAANAIGALVEQLTAQGRHADVDELCVRFGIPLLNTDVLDEDGEAANDNAIEVVFDDDEDCDGEDEGAECDAELEDESVAALASKMTEHGVDRCEHGFSNRCWRCGIERTRDFEIGPGGSAVWSVAWRPIRRVGVAA